MYEFLKLYKALILRIFSKICSAKGSLQKIRRMYQVRKMLQIYVLQGFGLRKRIPLFTIHLS